MSEYMPEEEFKQAVIDIAADICGNVNGPIDFSELGSRLKTSPPQNYRNADLKTREDIAANIGSIYVSGTTQQWVQRMGIPITYPNGVQDIRSNWPQYPSHPILCKMNVEKMSGYTVRQLGCRIFDNSMPRWLSKMLVFFKPRHDKIISSAPKQLSAAEIDRFLIWSEPSSALVKEFGPTDEAIIELWRLATERRIKHQLAEREKCLAEIMATLDQLAAEMIAFLEKAPFKPKHGALTNCADVPLGTDHE